MVMITSCSLRLVWLIIRTFSANKQYFSLTLNQPTVLSVMIYQSNKSKQTGCTPRGLPLIQFFFSKIGHHQGAIMHVDMHAWEESNIGSWWDQKGTCTCLRPRCFWQSKIHVWEIVGPRNGKKEYTQ